MPSETPSQKAMEIASRHLTFRASVSAATTERHRVALANDIDDLVTAALDEAIAKVRDWQNDVNPFDQICEAIESLKKEA